MGVCVKATKGLLEGIRTGLTTEDGTVFTIQGRLRERGDLCKDFDPVNHSSEVSSRPRILSLCGLKIRVDMVKDQLTGTRSLNWRDSESESRFLPLLL